jgi:UDP-N-acetylglucosamine--N-acetylmuramyl-(pentapeptide) pyrophosphoryl-undecaprenol N-acetylglucosamine transferase
MPLVLLAAGGTGGHLFPAEALAIALRQRALSVDLATDERATRYGESFPAGAIHVIPSATLRARHPLALARTVSVLALGIAKAYSLLARVRPAAVVGFGGYPTIPPLIAANLRGIVTIIHEQNGVMGRANRLLAHRVTGIATSFPGVAAGALAAKSALTGNPVRPAVVGAAQAPYPAFDRTTRLSIVAFGGSQGARIMADVVPAAIERLDPLLRARLAIVQQVRDEDLLRVREAYARLGVEAVVKSFFADLPARMAAAHLVISRAGASTIAELAAIGRPAIVVPLPHALDQDQLANAAMLTAAGGAVLVEQHAFTPPRLATEVAALAADPDRLVSMARAARGIGRIDAADRLAEFVLAMIRNQGSGVSAEVREGRRRNQEN